MIASATQATRDQRGRIHMTAQYNQHMMNRSDYRGTVTHIRSILPGYRVEIARPVAHEGTRTNKQTREISRRPQLITMIS